MVAGASTGRLEPGRGEIDAVEDGEEPVVGAGVEVDPAVAGGLEGRGRGLAEVRGGPEAVVPGLSADVALAETAAAGETDPRAEPGATPRVGP